MTVPIYITAAVIAVAVAYTSDRVGKRSPFIITLLCIMVVGFTMCISSSNPRVVYGGVFIATCAIYPAFPGVITWLANNLAGSYKRSVGMAIQIGVGNLGGVSTCAVLFLLFSPANRVPRLWPPTFIAPRTDLDLFSVTLSSSVLSAPVSLPPFSSSSTTLESTSLVHESWLTVLARRFRLMCYLPRVIGQLPGGMPCNILRCKVTRAAFYLGRRNDELS